MPAQPTDDVGFLLIHGSELGSWVWDRVVPELRRPSLAVDLPGRGRHPGDRSMVTVRDAVTSIASDVEQWGAARVILVAHSFSGVLVPAVAAALGDRVRAAVLLGATVPQQGKGWVHRLPGPQRAFLRLMYKVRPAGMLSPEGVNRKSLCNDLDEETTAQFLAHRVPEAPHLLLDPVPTAGLPATVPWHYVRLLEDRTISAAARERMIQELPDPTVHDLETGHLPMLARPVELAALLERIADDERG